jgi:hypothetical protein
MTPQGVIYRDLGVLFQLNFNHVLLFHFPCGLVTNYHKTLRDMVLANRIPDRLHWSEYLADNVWVMKARK